MWKTVCQSVIGTSHQQRNLPCQDFGHYQLLDENTLIGAVADGAGSAKFAEIGSKIAVEQSLLFLAKLNDRPVSNSEEELDANLENACREFFTLLVHDVLKTLDMEAKKRKCALGDFACTLLVFIATSEYLAAMQIGDGFILVRPNGGEYKLIFEPDKGEYINETTFVTSIDALKQMQIKILKETSHFICVATDGVEGISINLSNWQPFPPFFKPLEQYLQETEFPLEKDLNDFLSSERLNARTTDDKTLLLALWV